MNQQPQFKYPDKHRKDFNFYAKLTNARPFTVISVVSLLGCIQVCKAAVSTNAMQVRLSVCCWANVVSTKVVSSLLAVGSFRLEMCWGHNITWSWGSRVLRDHSILEIKGEQVNIRHRVGGVVLDTVLHASSEDAGTLISRKTLEIGAQCANIVVDGVFVLCTDQICRSCIVGCSKHDAVLMFPIGAKLLSTVLQSSRALDGAGIAKVWRFNQTVIVEYLHNRCRPPITSVQSKRDHWLGERVEEEHDDLDIGKRDLRHLDIRRRNGLVAVVDAALVDCGVSSPVRVWWSNSTVGIRRDGRGRSRWFERRQRRCLRSLIV